MAKYSTREAVPARRARRELSTTESRAFERIKHTQYARHVEPDQLYPNTSHLRPVGRRNTLRDYLSQLWERRHFIIRDTRNRVLSQHNEKRLGLAWLMLKPILDAAFYAVLFGLVLKVSRGMDNYIAWLLIGILMFRYTSSAISGSTRSIQGSRAMIRSFSFPKASIPISMVARDTITQLLVVLVLFVMIMLIPPHAWPTWTWIWFIPIFILQGLFNLGCAFFLARIGYGLPDLSEVVSFCMRILMYASAVIFPIERFVQNETALFIVRLNPVYQILDCYRVALLDGAMPSVAALLYVTAWAVGLTVFGFLFFWRGEESYSIDRQ